MTKNKLNNPEFLSTAEMARLLDVTRTAIFKKIKSGKIKAQKVGRNYIIPIEEFSAAVGNFVTPERKEDIEKLVKKAVKEYREAFRLLGRE